MSDLLLLLQQELLMFLWIELPLHREFQLVKKAEELELVLNMCCGPLWLPRHNRHRYCCSQHRLLLLTPYFEEKSDFFNQSNKKDSFYDNAEELCRRFWLLMIRRVWIICHQFDRCLISCIDGLNEPLKKGHRTREHNITGLLVPTHLLWKLGCCNSLYYW